MARHLKRVSNKSLKKRLGLVLHMARAMEINPRIAPRNKVLAKAAKQQRLAINTVETLIENIRE